MAVLARFGVSLEKNLLSRFNSFIKAKKYTNRSEAIRDLIRGSLVKDEWREGKEVAGAITLIYNHHERELVNKLMDIQHDYGTVIVSTQHVHIDHANCLEVIVVRGKPRFIQKLSDTVRAVRGVKHTALSMSSTGKDI